ncbi:unnamed protein product [Heterobilharzia americana]|nr:unnamed protein product [Heterobilharzia americana]
MRSNLTGAGRRNTHIYEDPNLLVTPRSSLNSDVSVAYNYPRRGNSFSTSQNLGGYSSSGRLRILNSMSKNYLSPSILDLSNGSCSRSLRDLYKSPERQIVTSRYPHYTEKSLKACLNHDFKAFSNSSNTEREQYSQRRHAFGNGQIRDCRIKYKATSPDTSEVSHHAVALDGVNGGSLKVEKRRDCHFNGFNSLDHEPSSLIHVKAHRMRKAADAESNEKSHDSVNKWLSNVFQPRNDSSHNGSCCMSGSLAVTLYGSKLTEYERKEIQDYPEVYFLGLGATKRYPHGASINDSGYKRGSMIPSNNVTGFDDTQSSYILVPNDHLAYRYEVLKPLGKGSFGHVVHAIDHCTKQQVAVKIVKSEPRFTRQAVEEIRILKALNAQQSDGEYNVVQLLDHFIFRGHVCMVFELLYINLLFSVPVRKLTYGILCCLELLYRNKVIHCDLKPENILLRRAGKSKIKVIDFGSSCYINECPYNYIQSRFYRAPEIILGLPYGTPIDMWSLGCILAEFITGEPLFPGEDASDQLACIMEILGMPPIQMIKKGSQSHHYFNNNAQPLYMIEQQHHIYGNQHVDKLQEAITNLNKSLNSSSSKHKRANSSKRQKIRKSPGSLDLVDALTSSKNSSVCLPLGETSSTGHKIPQPLDPDMIDFLKGCLTWNPDERMNPIEALEHPWIKKSNYNAYNNSDPCHTSNKTNYNSYSNGTSKQVSDKDFVANILGVLPSIMSDDPMKLNQSRRRYSYDHSNNRLSDLFERAMRCTSNPKSPDRHRYHKSEIYYNTRQYRSFLNNNDYNNNNQDDNNDNNDNSSSLNDENYEQSVSPSGDIVKLRRRRNRRHTHRQNNVNQCDNYEQQENAHPDSNHSLVNDENIISICETPLKQ